MSLKFKSQKPVAPLAAFIDYYWMLINPAEEEKQVVLLPDGRIDVLFSYSATEPFHVVLLGLATMPEQTNILPRTKIFGISFKLPAIEYLLEMPVAHLINRGELLRDDNWNITQNDLDDFNACCAKANEILKQKIKPGIDSRKEKLFELVYASNGAMPVKELSGKVYWSSRQINRYFNQQFGLSLKAYCDILRFRASFKHIAEGKLFPEENFADQSHFIKAIKKLSGERPKDLFKNKNDWFIQFSALSKK